MLENGTVIRIEGRDIFVEMAGGNCSSCEAKKICTGGEKKIVQIENKIGAKVGDKVTLEIPKRSFYLSLGLIFGMPIILVIGGFLVFNLLFSETISGLIGLSLLILWFLILAVLDKRIAGGWPRVGRVTARVTPISLPNKERQ